MLSIQTNVSSLVAQENLRVNTDFQARTIQRLTSGYRINSSGDDAAGLAIANKFRSDVAELSQGVRNANDGVSQLQIIDGGLSDISAMLDRMKTLATQSASGTFTGNRTTLDNEFQALISEIDRQANNVQLNSGGALNTSLNVYIGGSPTTGSSNAAVSIDLSGTSHAVDSTSLGIRGASVAGGGNAVNAAAGKDLTTAGALFLAAGGNQTFTLNYVDANGAAQTASIVVHGKTGGISLSAALSEMNSQLSAYGVTASTSSATATKGYLQFSSAKAFSITAVNPAVADALTLNGQAVTVDNDSLYTLDGVAASATKDNLGESIQFSSGGQTATVTFTTNTTAAAKVLQINAMTAALGITAVVNSAGNVSLESKAAFTVVKLADATTVGNHSFGTAALGNIAVTSPVAGTSDTGTATSALTLIASAVATLGLVQGAVGAGQNKLQYAINLAQSQISNFSAADSRIRDADVAAEAANLTKAQVLLQASMAAMAQANTAPQAVLALLRA